MLILFQFLDRFCVSSLDCVVGYDAERRAITLLSARCQPVRTRGVRRDAISRGVDVAATDNEIRSSQNHSSSELVVAKGWLPVVRIQINEWVGTDSHVDQSYSTLSTTECHY